MTGCNKHKFKEVELKRTFFADDKLIFCEDCGLTIETLNDNYSHHLRRIAEKK